MDEICFTTARDQLAQIRARTISVVELLEAHLRRIEQVNPQLNAIVTLEPEPALAAARAADAKLARGEEPGLLGGLPVAHKDLFETQGMRTTFGSPIFADFVPDPQRADRRAATCGRRDQYRQNQHARVRCRLTNLQPGLRRYAQSLQPADDLWRQLGRRGSGPGERYDPDRRRQRYGRQPAQPGRFLWGRRFAELPRARSGLARPGPLAAAQHRWPDGP
jgi:hypothetical protein